MSPKRYESMLYWSKVLVAYLTLMRGVEVAVWLLKIQSPFLTPLVPG